MATRLQSVSASDRMCELKNTVRPSSRSRRIRSRTSRPAERVEARHRLVEEDHLGIVDQRLGQADALQHALRELAQLQAPLGAEADLVEQAVDPRSVRSAPL